MNFYAPTKLLAVLFMFSTNDQILSLNNYKTKQRHLMSHVFVRQQ